MPDRQGLPPRYDQKTFDDADKRGQLRLVASADGRDGSVVIHQDSDIFAALLNDGEAVSHDLKSGRKAWVQVVRGSVAVNGETVRAGDGVALENETKVAVTARADGSEVRVFDLT
jgi:redox-sensitive bicupin YhaK (pirin superfamily)